MRRRIRNRRNDTTATTLRILPLSSMTLLLLVVAIASLFPSTTLAARCTLCGNQVIPKEAMFNFGNNNNNGGNGLYDNNNEDGNEILTCQSLLNRLSASNAQEFSDECRRTQLAAFQIGCCGESFVPRHACAVCPDGSPFNSNIPVPHTKKQTIDSTAGFTNNDYGDNNEEQEDSTTDGSSLTCGDLPDLPSFLDYFNTPGDCKDTYLQRSARWCECPGREIECSICPDGSPMPDPEKFESVLYGWDCATFEYVVALLDEQECSMKSSILEFDASSFCCPHVVPPPDVCQFCPSTQVLARREKEVITDYGLLTCGDIADSLSLVPNEESCDFAISKFNTDLCCEYTSLVNESAATISNINMIGVMFVIVASVSLLH